MTQPKNTDLPEKLYLQLRAAQKILDAISLDLCKGNTGQEGLTVAHLIDLPEFLREVALKLVGLRVASFDELAARLDLSESELKEKIEQLVKAGYLIEIEKANSKNVYQVAFGRQTRRKVPKSLWEALEEKINSTAKTDEKNSTMGLEERSSKYLMCDV